VNGWLVAVVVGAALALALASGIASARGKAPGRVVLGGCVLVEAALVILTAASVITMIGGERPGEMLTFVAYLVGVLVVLPLAIVWSLAEPTRWSNLVVAVGALTVMAMVARMDQIWRTSSG
jgi:hypothetical protein